MAGGLNNTIYILTVVISRLILLLLLSLLRNEMKISFIPFTVSEHSANKTNFTYATQRNELTKKIILEKQIEYL